MKLLARLALLGAVALSQSAWADTGPYYVSYPGYCNVKKVYLTPSNDVYGTEVGCAAILGSPVMGSMTVDNRVLVATVVSGIPCLTAYWTDGTLVGGCSAGGSISYAPRSYYTVRQSAPSGQPLQRQFNVTTELPDMQHTKNLPATEF